MERRRVTRYTVCLTVVMLFFMSVGRSGAETPSTGDVATREDSAQDWSIPPLRFQGEPFFPMGVFGWPREDPGFPESGGNTALKHVRVKGKLTSDALARMKERLRTYLKQCREEDIAAVLYPVKINGRKVLHAAHDRAFRKEVVRFLNAMLDVTGEHEQVLGYWAFGEPENHLWSKWKKRAGTETNPGEKAGDAFAKWANRQLGWFVDLLRRRDPDGYVMPTIAWWNMYEPLAPLVDVHVPNTYPTHKGEEPLTGSLYDVVYDAAKAAEAVRNTDVHSFLYMPGIFDRIGGDWRGATLREMRYLWFAPLTQGARGFLGWRISRVTPEHRKQVVYPVMKEVSRFRPWWLVPALDQRVRSNRDVASVEYLREFPELIREVAGEEIDRREVKGLPDVSYTLRHVEGEGYLLLAVNNRRERTQIQFQIRGLADTVEAHEVLQGKQGKPLTIRDGRLQDNLPPFGVRVYRFD